MDASALQMAVYELDGLSVSDRLSETSVYEFVDKLRDILLDRLFFKDTTYENVFPGSYSYRLNSIQEWFDGRELWNVGWLNLSADAGIDTWNQSSGFTYDIIDFAIICSVSCYSGENIMKLTKDTFSSFLPEVYEMNFLEAECYDDENSDELEDFYSELCYDCMNLIEEMQSCSTVTDWEEVHEPGLILLRDFSRIVFSSVLTPAEVFENIQPIAEFCFASLEGIYRTLYTFVNQHINVILQNEEFFHENTDFKEFRELLNLLENPIYDDNYGFEPIVVYNKKYYSITVLETEKSNKYNSRPFLGQLLDRIDELTLLLYSLLPAELLPVTSN